MAQLEKPQDLTYSYCSQYIEQLASSDFLRRSPVVQYGTLF